MALCEDDAVPQVPIEEFFALGLAWAKPSLGFLRSRGQFEKEQSV